MNVSRERNEICLSFNLVEGRLLLRVLRSIRKNYALKPEEIDERTAAAWYSTKGCQAAGMSLEETREWLEALHEIKSTSLRLIEAWFDQVSRPHHGRYQLRVAMNDAPTLLRVLNDHRLLMAARNDIGQGEMDAHDFETAGRLSLKKQVALLDIHFLAWMVEEILRQMPGNPGGWNSGG